MLYTLIWVFDQSQGAQGPIYLYYKVNQIIGLRITAL